MGKRIGRYGNPLCDLRDFRWRGRPDLAQTGAVAIRSAPGRTDAEEVCDHSRRSRLLPRCGVTQTFFRRREAVLAEREGETRGLETVREARHLSTGRL